MSGSPIGAPRLPDSIATGDFNLDGLTDLAVTSHYSNPSGWLTVFLGVPGGFVTAPGSPLAVGNSPSSIVVEDFNHDGWTDLVLAISGLPDEARWYFGDGTGRFVWSGARFRAASDIISLRVADLDLDGKPDLVVANGSWPPSVTIVFGFATTATVRLDLSAVGGCWGATVGYVNLDSSPDIVCLGQQSLTVFLGDGQRHFTQAFVGPFSSGPYFTDAELTDFNLDGRPDLVVTKGSIPYAVKVFLGDGTGRFAEAASSPIQDLGRLGELQVSDFNSDGRPDFAAVSFDLNAVGIYLGTPLLSADGTSCFDGNPCTSMDRCSSGRCISGPPLTCDDGNPCTTDSCNPAIGCLFTNNSNICEDGNACTLDDLCSGGECHPGRVADPKTDCNDNNACTTDWCDGDIGCMHAPIMCRDGNPSTIDSCDPRRGCVFTPRHGRQVTAGAHGQVEAEGD